MNIGEAAKATGMSVKMIRYYESIDLIHPHGRAESGYRIYKESDVHVMRFIRQTRALGFSVEGVRHLLALWRDEDRASSDVKSVALKHVAELNAQIAELTSMRDSLDRLVNSARATVGRVAQYYKAYNASTWTTFAALKQKKARPRAVKALRPHLKKAHNNRS
jgi:MerR family transcriptional regulator, copper efflux regulator